MYHVLVTFLFGAGMTMTITNFGKYAIGRLRPHFISVCMPIGDEVAACNPDGVGAARYVAAGAYVCNGTLNGFTSSQLRDARLSFPSGHSSFAVYTMPFLAVSSRRNLNRIAIASFLPCLLL
jgi:phosphatidate phosphatase